MDPLLVTIIVICCMMFYMYTVKQKNYWKNINVPHLTPLTIWGNIKPMIMLEKAPGPFLGDLYQAAPALGQRYLGFFLLNCEPALLIRDPELVKRILVQDFDHFRNRYVECPTCDPIGEKNLFVIRGEKWKYLRNKLSPTFSSGKMKQMFLSIKDVVMELCKVIDDSNAAGTTAFDCRELLSRYTTDVINVCAFGIKANSLGNPKSEFRHFGKKIFNTSTKRAIETRAFFFMHWLANTFKFSFFEKESSKFMRKIFTEIITDREKSAMNRNDFIDVLIKLKNDIKRTDVQENMELSGLDEDSVIAQAALFYTAGFETTSSTLTMTLVELALQPQLQKRVREEVSQVLKQNGDNLEYDSLSQLKFLDAAISETLRMYPPMPFLDRICTKDYKIPESDVTIKKGTPIFISLYRGLHYDNKYFPNPEKYDPERFTSERKGSLEPYSYMPFGEGPHICLGMRFGMMNTKITLATIFSKYEVKLSDKTHIPFEINPRAIILNTTKEIYLEFHPV